MRPILALAWAEVLHIVRDRATLVQVLLIPIVQLLVLTNAATFKIRDTPMYVVDLDRSAISRGLIDRFAASGHFKVLGYSASPDVANEALLDGEVAMVLSIPEGLERNAIRVGNAPVQLIMNAEKGSIAGIVQFYAGRIISSYSSQLTQQYRAGNQMVKASIHPSYPLVGVPKIDIRTSNWYNPTLNYHHYMVPGILVALVTLIGTLLAAQNLAREKELGTLEQLNVTPITQAQLIVAKLLPLWVLAMGEFAIGIVIGKYVFGMPIQGSVLLLLGIAAIYLVGALGIGFWISTIVETQQQAMFITFFVVIIYFLLSGLFTPLDSMPQWVQWMAEINPVRHFVEIARSILIKGAGVAEIMRPLLMLVVISTTVVALMGSRLRKTAA